MPPRENIAIEDANVFFLNFSGIEKMYNSAGDRNFCVELPKDVHERLLEEGHWNIKQSKVTEEGEVPTYYIKVNVKYGTRPPRIILVNSKGRLELDEDSVAILDSIDIKQWDVILNPYFREDATGKKTRTAYLKQLYAVQDENVFDLKYADLPQSNPTTSLPDSTVNDEEDE